MTGKGTTDFMEAIGAAREEYEMEYKAEYQRLLKEKKEAEKVWEPHSLQIIILALSYPNLYTAGYRSTSVFFLFIVAHDENGNGRVHDLPPRTRRWC